MAEDKRQTPADQAPTTAKPLRIPEELRTKLDVQFTTLASKVREFSKKYNLPANITNAIIADVKDFLQNDYQGLHLDADSIVYIGSTAGAVATDQDFYSDLRNSDYALSNLFDDYGRVATLIRWAGLQHNAQDYNRPIYEDAMQEARKNCGPLALYEWARYITDYDPDFINEKMLRSAQFARYVDFLVYAATQLNTNASQLLQVDPPQIVKDDANQDGARLIVDQVISAILSAPLELEHILGLHEDLEAKEEPPAATKNYNKTTANPSMIKTAPDEKVVKNVADQVLAATASTIAKRMLIFYQPNMATLARPIEAKKEGVLSTEVVALHSLQGYKTARPLPLTQIITALADRVQISPARVTQTLQALQIIAQDKPDKITTDGQGNEYYVYNGYTITALARIVLGTNQPSAPDIKEVFQALELITTLRIGHDEDHVVGKSKKTGKDKIVRYRHFTQFVQVPDIRVKLDKDNQIAGDPKLTLQIHRLIPTGRRSDKQIEEDGQKQLIASPQWRKVSIDELDQARKLFKGDQGIRFYNFIKSAGHVKEPDLMAAVFDYDGQRAAAKYRAAQILEEARQGAANANTKEAADEINNLAKKRADAVIQAAEETIRKHKPRDRQRLYGWLQDALDNFFIVPPKGKAGLFSDAKDGSTDGRGRPVRVISWDKCETK